ncbi:MAG: hypothetical protein HYR63_15870 [Proteobacteria bacterium]|nr:hypothetical protein [Pseudomonadota bacterium]MBI3499691.1 hypothetical protein [Pseudomonadota bacterium]
MKTGILPKDLLPPSRRLPLIGLLLVSITIAAAGATIWDLRQAQIEDYRQDMTNVGVLLTEQTSRLMQAVDLVVTDTREKVLASRPADAEAFKRLLSTEETHRFLKAQLERLPQADALALASADGKIINFTRGWPVPDIDIADRDYYRYFRDHDELGVFISEPVQNRANGAWTFYLDQRINGPKGEFLGLVHAAIGVQYLKDLYKTLNLRKGVSVTLLCRDGTIVAREPDIVNAMGGRIPMEAPWHERVAEGGGTYRSPGYFDGVVRVVTVHPLKDYPLVVDVAVIEDEALAHWRTQSTYIAGGAACVVVAFALLFRLLSRQFRRLEDQAAELTRGAHALSVSERRFRDYTKTASDWYWETGPDHRFTGNPEGVAAHGIDPTGWLGKRRWEIAADTHEDPDKWSRHAAMLERREPFRDFVYKIRLMDGSIGYVSSSGNPVFEENGAFLGYRGTGRSVTQQIQADEALRQAKEEAEAANRTKSQFLANMSHELRTPLNAVIGFSEVIRDKGLGSIDPRYRDYAADIHKAGQHLLDLINDVLDLSKIEVGKLELREEVVDLGEVVEQCVHIVAARADAGRIMLERRIPATLPTVVGDRLRIKQILLNLLSNAIKFTPAGGRVAIGLTPAADGGLGLWVADSGIGMKPEDIPTALAPFRQVDGGMNRRHEGTGLGLPLASRLAELHDGALEIESRFGHGTTVWFCLPARRVQRGVPQSAREPAPAPSL